MEEKVLFLCEGRFDFDTYGGGARCYSKVGNPSFYVSKTEIPLLIEFLQKQLRKN